MPQLNSAQQMLGWADAAFRFSRNKLTNGSANPYGAIPGTQFRAEAINQQNMIREAVQQAYNTPNAAAFQGYDPVRITLCDAKIAMGMMAGNCDQFASVAFSYLFAHDCWPVYKAQLPGHTFVLLGNQQEFAICDGWAAVACTGNDLGLWLNYIWGPGHPNWNQRVIVAAWEQQGGSEKNFLDATNIQTADVSMDFSD